MAFINRYKTMLKGREQSVLYKWLQLMGQHGVYKRRNVPEMLLNEYKAYLTGLNKSFDDNDDETRMNVIKQYVAFIIDVQPQFKKLLKRWGSTSYEIGMLMYGYSSSKTWHSSYKKPFHISSIVTLINKHEELLTRLNNPK